MGVFVVAVAFLALVACDVPPPNPLASLGGTAGPVGSGGAGGTLLGSDRDAGADAGGRPTPAPVMSQAAALSIETAPTPARARTWAAVDCPGGPCVAPNVCVNLDFLFVACVPCGGEDQICCPHTSSSEPSKGSEPPAMGSGGEAAFARRASSAPASECDAGLACGPNPNFQPVPPLDLVRRVCQRPGAPPPADRGLNHQRQRFGL